MKIVVKDISFDNEIREFSLEDLLDFINKDRGDDWVDFDETDWQESLTFTNFELVEIKD